LDACSDEMRPHQRERSDGFGDEIGEKRACFMHFCRHKLAVDRA